jgi:hypothetical protein
VRTRAGLSDCTTADFTGPRDFLDKLLMERSYEHYREGFRRQDLSRDDPAWTPYGKKSNGWDNDRQLLLQEYFAKNGKQRVRV